MLNPNVIQELISRLINIEYYTLIYKIIFLDFYRIKIYTPYTVKKIFVIL